MSSDLVAYLFCILVCAVASRIDAPNIFVVIVVEKGGVVATLRVAVRYSVDAIRQDGNARRRHRMLGKRDGLGGTRKGRRAVQDEALMTDGVWRW